MELQVEKNDYYYSLREFLRNQILPLILSISENIEEEILIYTSDKYMGTWVQSFTHETARKDYDYEELELLGDKLFGAAFVRYLMEREPLLKKNELSSIVTKYEQNIAYVDIVEKFNFNKYVLVDPCIKSFVKVKEDIFESFLGALFVVSEDVLPGMGFINIYNFIIEIFEDVEITEADKKTDPKSFVIQSIETLGFKNQENKEGYKPVFEKFNTMENGKIRFGVYLRSDVFDRFYQIGIKFRKNINPIGEGIAGTKTGAEKIAYEQAQTFLFSIGLTKEELINISTKILFMNPQIKNFQKSFFDRLYSEGFKDFKIQSPKKVSAKNLSIQALYGIKSNGKTRILLLTIKTKDSYNNNISPKDQLIIDYAMGIEHVCPK